MDENTPKKLVVLSLFIVALSIVFVRDIKSIIDNSFFKEKYVLVIGILSSPQNFRKRLGLRKTWLRLASGLSVVYYFAIGENICAVHPLDRVNNHSCVENPLNLPKNVTTETNFMTMKKRENAEKIIPSVLPSTGFGFRAVVGVTITKLGVLKILMSQFTDVQVKLICSFSKKILASVTIDEHSSSGKNSEFVLKSIKPVHLMKGSEAHIVVKALNSEYALFPSCEDFQWQFSPGAIEYLQMMHFGERKPWPFQQSSCSYVLFTYSITDLRQLRSHIDGRDQRKKEWKAARKALMQQLKNESSVYKDILFLNTVDVYRNLPKKLIHFFKRMMETDYFHYVLKTDDDSFVDILRVYSQLLSVSRDMDESIQLSLDEFTNKALITNIRLSKFWWWSRFREFWRVQEVGKWRDDKYRSAAYPTFPCGGGYVLNRGIVNYLTENSRNLQYFQGEDVSVGIWVSGLNTIQYRTPKVISEMGENTIQNKIIRDFGGDNFWIVFSDMVKRNKTRIMSDQCEWTCDNKRDYDMPLCNKVQLKEGEMMQTWQEYLAKGYI